MIVNSKLTVLWLLHYLLVVILVLMERLEQLELMVQWLVS